MKKKLLTGILATLACFACLTGCDLLAPMSPGNNNSQQQNSSSTGGNVSEPSLEMVKNFLKAKYDKEIEDGREDYEVLNTITLQNVTYSVSWSSDVTDVTVEVDGNVSLIFVNKLAKEDVNYSLTATITDANGNTEQVVFRRTILAAPMVPHTLNKAPVVGTAYKYHVYQAGRGELLYLNGKMKNTYYLGTTTDMEAAIDVYVEDAGDNSFYIYCNNNVGKQYINIIQTDDSKDPSRKHINSFLQESATSKWTYSTEYGTMVTTFNDTVYCLGATKTYDTLQPIKPASLAATDYVANFIELIDRDNIPATDKVTQTERELTMPAVYVDENVMRLARAGATFPEVNIAWSVSGAGATLENSKLTLATPTTTSELVLTATITCGEETATKEFTITHIPNTEEAIVAAAFAMENGELFGNKVTLTGVITSVDTEYSADYANITVTIKVGDKEIECYRMVGNGADEIKKGDTITVNGTLKKYNSTVEFDSACEMTSFTPGTGEEDPDTPPTPSEDVKALLDKAYALEKDTALDGTHTLSGVITSIDDAYSTQFKNITVTIKVNGDSEGRSILCYRIKGDGADTLAVGDTITVTGVIKNYNGTVEFDAGTTIDAIVKGEGGGEVGGNEYEGKAPVAITEAPVVGTEYKLHLYHPTSKKNYYATGKMDGYYYETTENPAEGIDVLVETTTGGFFMYFMDGSSKTYLNVIPNDGHNNVLYQTTAVSVWSFNATVGTLVTSVTVDGTTTELCLGTRSDKTYDTISANALSYEPFIACLVTMEDEGDIPAPTYETLTVPQFIELGKQQTAYPYATVEMYYVTGTIIDIEDAAKGNMTIADAEGNAIYIYNTFAKDGTTAYGDMTEGKPAIGDTVKFLSVAAAHYGVPQLKNAAIQEVTAGELTAIQKAAADALEIEVPESIGVDSEKTVTLLTVGTANSSNIAWTVDNTDVVALNNGVATFTLPATATKVIFTATVTNGEVSKTYTYEVEVAAALAPGSVVTTFSPDDYETFGLTFDGYFTENKAYTKNNVSLSTSQKEKLKASSQIRIFKGGDLTISVPAGYVISSITVVGVTESKYQIVDAAWVTNATVEGVSSDNVIITPVDGSKAVTINATGNQVRILQLQVVYKEILVPATLTAAPAVDTAAKFYVFQGNLGKVLYLDGTISGNFLSTTEVAAEAADIYLATAEGGYNVYFKNGDAKTYINLNDKNKLVLGDTAATVWTYDETLNTLVSNDYYIGTYNQYATFSASQTKYATTSFVGHFANLVNIATVADADKIAQTKKELAMNAFWIGEATANLQTVGKFYPTVNVTWALTGEGATLENNVLTMAPTAVSKPVLTATITSGDSTETYVVSLTLVPNTTEAIVDAAYQLAEGEAFGSNVTLKGVIKKIDYAYSSKNNNITVTMEVAGKTIQCYKLTGDGIDQLAVDYEIEVNGLIKNYNGTIEFDTGCTLESYTEPTFTEKTISEMIAIGKEPDDRKYYVTGTIIDIASADYGNMTIADAEGNAIYVYGTYKDGKAYGEIAEADKPVLGDTVKFISVATNYNGAVQLKNAEIEEITAKFGGEFSAIHQILIDVNELDIEDTIAPADATETTKEITLPTTLGDKGTTVAWTCADADAAIVTIDGGKATYTFSAAAAKVTLTATLTNGETSKAYVYEIAVGALPTGNITVFKADFETLNDGVVKTTYATYSSTAGWTIENAQAASLVNGDINLDANYTGIAPLLNGKTTAQGKITSPTLTKGITKLSFNYGFLFSDTKIKLGIVITPANGTPIETTLEATNLTKGTAYSYEYVLETPIKGDFTITITNLSISNSTSNKDRVSIWNFAWEIPVATKGTADFETLNEGVVKTTYATYSSTAGWTIENAQAASLVNGDINLDANYTGIAPLLNGKTTAQGKITSPTLTKGITKLSFNYGFLFSDTKIKLGIVITPANGTPIETTLEATNLTKGTAYSYEYVLETPITGDFTITITNLSISNSTSNKDRVSIWNLVWVNA